MKIKRGFLAVAVCAAMLGMAGAAAATDQTEAQAQPRIFVSEASFHFEPVVDGVSVKHDFSIQNQGTAALNIKNVRTG